MRIHRYCNPRIGKVYSRPPPATQRKTSISKSRKLGNDEVSLSPHAAEVRKFTKLAKTIPDVRQEKVESIKKQIKAGTYKVPAELVAKSIIDSIC